MSFVAMRNEVTEMSIGSWMFWRHLARRLPRRFLRVHSVAYPKRNPWGSMYDIDATLRHAVQGSLRLTRDHVLLVRRFRQFHGGEFLKVRIIPEQIEHGIEPEQRRREERV
jgi:hypothetical protein